MLKLEFQTNDILKKVEEKDWRSQKSNNGLDEVKENLDKIEKKLRTDTDCPDWPALSQKQGADLGLKTTWATSIAKEVIDQSVKKVIDRELREHNFVSSERICQ